MNFEFSDEQNMVREQARNYLAEHASSTRVREVLDSTRPYDEALWRGIAELGWNAAAIPEAYGGLALGRLTQCVIAEELGRSLAPVPFASSIYLAVEALLQAGSEDQKRDCLPKLASGEWIGAFAAGGGIRARDGRLHGTQCPVVDGDVADIAVVAAHEGDSGGQSLYLVRLDDDTVARQSVETLDPTRSCASLTFRGTSAQFLGNAGEAGIVLERVRERAAVLFAFEQLGGAQACLQMSRDYAMERYAFGRPIGALQAIKHKLADMYTAIELLHANALYAAWALSVDADDLPLAAATARVAGIQAYYQASKENIQTHGGMGFTWEFDCHLHYRRAHALAVVIGNEAAWKRRLVAALKTTAAA